MGTTCNAATSVAEKSVCMAPADFFLASNASRAFAASAFTTLSTAVSSSLTKNVANHSRLADSPSHPFANSSADSHDNGAWSRRVAESSSNLRASPRFNSRPSVLICSANGRAANSSRDNSFGISHPLTSPARREVGLRSPILQIPPLQHNPFHAWKMRLGLSRSLGTLAACAGFFCV